MAKITVMGDAVVITSALKLEDLKNVAKYRKKSLVLKGGEDGKEPVFAIGITKGDNAGSIDANGAMFGRADANGNAMITFIQSGDQESIKERLADRLGGAMINLNKLEEQLTGVIGDIAADKARVLDSIRVVGPDAE